MTEILKDSRANQKGEWQVSKEEILKHRCSCGALMILFDNHSECQGYSCPQCGNMKFALKKGAISKK